MGSGKTEYAAKIYKDSLVVRKNLLRYWVILLKEIGVGLMYFY